MESCRCCKYDGVDTSIYVAQKDLTSASGEELDGSVLAASLLGLWSDEFKFADLLS